MSQILDELKQAKEELTEIGQLLDFLSNQRDKIKQDFKLDELKVTLQNLPNEIAEYQQKQGVAKADIEQIESDMKSIEAELIYLINMESNGKEKPKFSNAESRKAELNRRLDESKPYQEAKRKKIELEAESLSYEIKLNQRRDQFRAVLAIKDLVCAELNLYK